jgi:hypothetical protein
MITRWRAPSLTSGSPLQQLGDLEQEGIAIMSGKRCRGGKDRHHLRIGKSKRRHW